MKGLLTALIVLLLASSASAAEPWVDRRIVLSGNPVGGRVDLGLGFGHLDYGCRYNNNRFRDDCNGAGINAEAVLGIVKRVDIGFRVGLRFGTESGAAQADSYARFYDANTFYPFVQGNDVVADPEIRVRGKLLDLGVFELGLEGRLYLPVYDQNWFATAFGVPMAVHVGHLLKIDFGVYTLIADQHPNPVLFAFDAPANFWFQVTRKVWLGPMAGVRFYNRDIYADNNAFDIILGFGFGVSVTKWLDIKGQFVFPRVNEGAQWFGTGVGVGFIFE